ncbi:hypothetical protein [Kitasatospora sp. NPDC094015]|uniref:hypothetical protein n=1 Tax=Kitasatospora sp. NPDC094015 TaxID=3155205 RepID=UPI0033191843
MTVTGTFTLTISGPAESLSALLADLAAARMSARPVPPAVREPGAEELGWIAVEFHEGTDGQPSPEFQHACVERLDVVRARYGYEQRASSTTGAGASEFREVVDVRTGRVVIRGFLTAGGDVEAFKSGLGVEPAYLVVREPADLWVVPPADAD